MRKGFETPDQFDHRFTTHVMFFGMECKVIVAFDDPDDTFVFLNNGGYNITYDLSPKESMRMTNLANEMMENM